MIFAARKNEARRLKMDNTFISFAGVDHNNIQKYELDHKIYNCRIHTWNPYHRSTSVAILKRSLNSHVETRSIFRSPLLKRLNSILQLSNPMPNPPTHLILNTLRDLRRIILCLNNTTLPRVLYLSR